MLLRYANSGGYKNKPIGNCDDCWFTIIVNSVSMAAPIGLLPRMAKFCHTSNRLLLGRQRCRALLRLYFDSSATGWLVGNENCYAMTFGGDENCYAMTFGGD